MRDVFETTKDRQDGLSDLVRLLSDRLPSAIAFLLAAFLAVVGLSMAVPPSDKEQLGILGKKVAYLRNYHEDYNVLFIGTSRTYRGVDPVLLQKIAAEQGCDVRAFNLGVSKLRLTELRHLSAHLSPAMLGHYDLILMSPMASSGIAAANWGSNRIRHFTDWEGYKVSLVDIWHVPTTGIKSEIKKLLYSVQLTGAFAYRQLGIGRLATILGGQTSVDGDNQSGDLFDGAAIVDFSRHGYVALDDEPHEQFLTRGETILRNPGYFEGLKTRKRDVRNFRGPTAERAYERFRRAKNQLAEMGVPIALFLPPMLPNLAADEALAETVTARDLPVMNLNRLDLHPDLFDVRHWFDYYHVGKSGAELLTTMIGERICPMIQQAQG